MEPTFDISKQTAENISKVVEKHGLDVMNSDQFKNSVKFINDFTLDFLQAIKAISLYSTRAKDLYNNFLIINASDDIIQSAVGIRSLAIEGIQNMAKRELRYLIEMSVKYLIVDQEMAGKLIGEKTQYLSSNIPNSSIDVINRMHTSFDSASEVELKNEITDFFYKSCAYVHPSQKQIEEQMTNSANGFTIGLESAKSLSDLGKITFRAYDMILALMFIGFGDSMSGDLFINVFDGNPKWKFHKGKYVKKYSSLFDYKCERQRARE